MKKAIIVLLVFSMLITLTMGCDNSPKESVNPGNDVQDLGDYEFIIRGNDFVVGQSGVDPIKDELKTILQDIESESSCKITAQPDISREDIVAASMAGDNAGDIYYIDSGVLGPSIRSHKVIPLDDNRVVAAGLDPTDSNLFFPMFTETVNVYNKYWGVAMASKHLIPQFGLFLIYNKKLLTTSGISLDELTNKIKTYSWDFDTLISYCKQINLDIDGDGMNPAYNDDIWGLGNCSWGDEVYFCGGSFMVKNSDGKFTENITNQKTLDGLYYMQRVQFLENIRSYCGTGETNDAFRDGRVGFNWVSQSYISDSNGIGNMTDPIGVAPNPRGPTMEPGKYLIVVRNRRVMAIPTQNKNVTNTAVLMKKLGSRLNNDSWQDVYRDDYFRGDEENMDIFLNYVIKDYSIDYSELDPNIFETVKNSPMRMVWMSTTTPRQGVESSLPMLLNILESTINSYEPPK